MRPAYRSGVISLASKINQRHRGLPIANTVTPASAAPDKFPRPPAGPPPPADIGRLLLRCHDGHGIIAAVSTFLTQAGANIISLDQSVRDDGLIVDLIDSAEFQRLRRIKQLGLAMFTYQGAEHSRFTHSLGVMHLMTRALHLLGAHH